MESLSYQLNLEVFIGKSILQTQNFAESAKTAKKCLLRLEYSREKTLNRYILALG